MWLGVVLQDLTANWQLNSLAPGILELLLNTPVTIIIRAKQPLCWPRGNSELPHGWVGGWI